MRNTLFLSIGDGLVSQVPAIIISIAAGILVTRSSEEANLGEFVGKQLTDIPPCHCELQVACFCCSHFFLSDTFWPFFHPLSMVCFGAAYHLLQSCRMPRTLNSMQIGQEHQVPRLHLNQVVYRNNLHAPNSEEGQDGINYLPWRMQLSRRYSAWKWGMVYLVLGR